jgi:transposase InsO family protein
MKYAWIEKNTLRWPVCVQCRVLEVSISGYHQHRARQKKILTRRHLSETALLVEIRAVYAEARGAYGWPRVWRCLKASGVGVGKRRIQRAMQQNGLRARGRQRFRVVTPTATMHCPSLRTCSHATHRGRAEHRLGRRHDLYSHPRRVALSGRGAGPVQPAHRGLVDGAGDHGGVGLPRTR